jgi:hypothetical protein
MFVKKYFGIEGKINYHIIAGGYRWKQHLRNEFHLNSGFSGAVKRNHNALYRLSLEVCKKCQNRSIVDYKKKDCTDTDRNLPRKKALGAIFLGPCPDD